MNLNDVSLQTGLPAGELDALETGTVDRIPDRVHILKVLRRYADFLGLPGDRYVVVLVDHWPASATVMPPVVSVNGIPAAMGAPTGAVAAPVTPAPVSARDDAGGNGVAPPTSLMTGPVGTADVGPATAQVPGLLQDTGVQPAVPPASVGARRRRRGAPAVLRAVVIVVAVLVVVALAGLAVNHFQPRWLHRIGINTSSDSPSTTAAATTATSAPGAGSTGVAPAAGPSRPAPSQAAFSVGTSTASGVSFAVRAPSYTVNVRAVGGEAWVEASADNGAHDEFAGILSPGQTKSFSAQQTFTLSIGSRAANISVTDGHKLLGVYVPTVAPYTLTFHSVS